ncbi:ABC transporter ATP-binding protein [Levilactobacillus suantsaii]|uniref:sn-glycerol-3-phosphate ABC transporter ATP-binding protein UgpC n=1 Tax=Levilactobacillus suantsaii TaxID=2292255 RepID=A0A4V1LF61_9LACO|nr:sn-glycerol-3-phosphate ABC transporter ATP-binding protein UgpC [Levilactobacillus suantsaii]QMU08058.1 sn-glycerol-3-phosphate ABC transporter ATP-binding protein UgpC [Levilactobacillus suantsaii]RXI76754.1 sn-glycerol-3-phosphate ABC transporter ATP-binding protein UgpC [Levilactobacillus suantsaii]
MSSVSLEHIYKKYDGSDEYSVTDFNLEVKDKEFIVFVGPSGCGKSTTLRMISGLEEITKGTLKINGEVANTKAPKDRDIAMVFQNYALYPHMTVYQNMAFGLKMRKYDKDQIDKRVKHAATILGLTEFLPKRPSALSGGQRQRVALGRAIVRDAPIFLMDEPLSNLDAKLRVSMRTEIARLHRSLDTTTIYVTHDQTEAMTMADRIVVMKDGAVQQIGTPAEVYDNPVNVFVGGFIGAPPMNFFTLDFDGKYLTDKKNGIQLLLRTEQARKLIQRGYEGKSIILGIRPENIRVDKEFVVAHPDTTINGEIVVSELLGNESQLYCKVNDKNYIAKVNARDHEEPGTKKVASFDLDRVHFFDPETELVLK